MPDIPRGGDEEDIYAIPRPGRIKLKESSRDTAEKIYAREHRRFQREQEKIARINNLPLPTFTPLSPFDPFPPAKRRRTEVEEEWMEDGTRPYQTFDDPIIPSRYQSRGDHIHAFGFGLGGMSIEEYTRSIRAQFISQLNFMEMEQRNSRRDEEIRLEYARLAREEKEAEEERRRQRRSERRRIDKERKAKEETKKVKRERYINRWKSLVSVGEIEETNLTYTDIPWPTYSTLDKEQVKTFMLDMASDQGEEVKRVLRETIRSYHPDRFFGRILPRVRENERERVKDGVELSSRIINALAAEL